MLALCGENGAGKSTLMKCLSGVYQPDPDSGEILYQGKPVRYTNPNDAKKDGIVLIFQKLSLVMDLSVAENIYLGSLPMKHGRVDWKKLYSDAQAVLDKLGCPASPKDVISTLPIAQQQMVEIARGIGLDDIVQAMIGRTLDGYFHKCTAEPGEEVLRVENLSLRGVYKDISFHVRRREVVGFYGLVGAGRSEIMETIFGVRRPDAGDIYMNGKKSSIRTSVDAVKNKIGFVTENRKEQGLVLDKSCRENIALAKLPWISKGGFVDDKATYDIYNEYHDKLRISSPSSEQQIVYLSGGNQQKVVIGKWLTTEPDLLILDEPTRGIDVGSKSEIHKLIADLAESGMAVIVISSEMPEIMGVSNRIYTIAQGLITGELTGDEITEENLIKAITITESAKHA